MVRSSALAAMAALLVAVPATAQRYWGGPGYPAAGYPARGYPAPYYPAPYYPAPVPARPVPVEDAAPQPPAGAAVGFVPPERDEVGYRTPNRDLPDGEAVWHVRVALNVAALGCRGAGDEDLTAAYNALLEAERGPLATAAATTQAHYRARSGAAWQARYDDDMTRLYNYFAQPPAHRAFCATAGALLHEAQGVPVEGFAAFAAAALPRLEAPFTTFYAAYDDYRGALATWQARHRPMVIATNAPAPLGPVAAARRLPEGPDGD